MHYSSSWRSPSNIALIKYWGKHGIQLPRNPSLSFTLSACHTVMTMVVNNEANTPKLTVLFDGMEMPSFIPKIKLFFNLIKDQFPWVETSNVVIDSVNTFPHGSGIASSASSMSALALCLVDIDDQLKEKPHANDPSWWRRVSEIARLGSGSACRSIFPVAALWGKTEDVTESNDAFAIPWEDQLAPYYKNYQDTILVVSSSEKKVSSSAGHELMSSLPYAQTRYAQAGKNLKQLIDSMHHDDQDAQFMSICESEALQLHALMLMGEKPYMLIEPNTVSIINAVWNFRKETSVPVCFTLDAGPNVHLLYPEDHKSSVHDFIKSDLRKFCNDGLIIMDEVGEGPKRLNGE